MKVGDLVKMKRSDIVGMVTMIPNTYIAAASGMVRVWVLGSVRHHYQDWAIEGCEVISGSR